MTKYISPTPDQIIAARGTLSQVACAAMVLVSVSTWRAWEYGQNPMPLGLWKLFLIEQKNNFTNI